MDDVFVGEDCESIVERCWGEVVLEGYVFILIGFCVCVVLWVC